MKGNDLLKLANKFYCRFPKGLDIIGSEKGTATNMGEECMNIVIQPMKSTDWPMVKDIYVEGIQTGNATFQQEAPSWEEWDHSHVQTSRLVAWLNDKIVGWAALSPTSSRCVYAGVAEVSVYVGGQARGLGVGGRLLDQLIQSSEHDGFWTLQSGIFPENAASIAIHKKYGFEVLGTRKRIGKMNGTWRDVVLMERRSQLVGMD
ncbi:MAG: GNAT family N-acetyltransferase [Bacillaceae bacterium]